MKFAIKQRTGKGYTRALHYWITTKIAEAIKASDEGGIVIEVADNALFEQDELIGLFNVNKKEKK